MLGEKLRQLREVHGLLQRQVANAVGVDITYISKIESNEKLASKSLLKKLSHLYRFPENELHTLWLADKLYGIVNKESQALPAIRLAEKELLNKTKRVK